MSNEQNVSLIGTASYANGERQEFTSAEDFIKTLREELPDRSTTGFTYEVLTGDAKTRKAVDDLAYNEYGEKNPHDLAYYEAHPKKVVKKEQPDTAPMTMADVPLYKYPGSYAREHDELPQYRASHKANVACRDAIDVAIRDNYRDNCLGSDTAKQVIAEFGFDRTLYVLANTVREKDWDGRIDHRNKDWARTIPVFDDENGFGNNRNREFIVDRSHPGLLDLFVNQARREYLLSQPLTKEDIQQEAARILGKLQDARELNSPNGTHYMAQISQDFLLRAGTKEQDKLFAMLPFDSLTFSGMKDRKGLFATISKDENRNQPLCLRKPSVRDKLRAEGKTTGTPKPHKRKEAER